MARRLARLIRWISRNWNAALAGVSLALVAIFALVPNGEKLFPFFYFAAANAVVWTIVEIKSLIRAQDDSAREFASMRSARGAILEDLRHGARHSREGRKLRTILVGGRIRSMSDIVLEIADELYSGRTAGHVELALSCIDPDYLADRVVPGDLPPAEQRIRNVQVAVGIRSTIPDLRRRGTFTNGSSSMSTTVATYASDPTHYAVLIEGVAVYWGPYTWSKVASDWVGPENGCIRFSRTSSVYQVLKDWIENRTALNVAEQLLGTEG